MEESFEQPDPSESNSQTEPQVDEEGQASSSNDYDLYPLHPLFFLTGTSDEVRSSQPCCEGVLCLTREIV